MVYSELMGLRETVRDTLDRIVPTLTLAYRLRRNQLAAAEAVQTPHGFKISCPPLALTGQWYFDLIHSGKYESEETAVIMEILQRDSVFVDIGANVGWFTCLAASRGSHVVSFEPNPTNLLFLYQSLDHNKMTDVEVFPLALSHTPGIVRMYGACAAASLLPGWHKTTSTESSAISIPATTLDIAIGRRFSGRQMLIKMDVEGFEWEVLAGAREVLLMEPKPVWLIESILNPDTSGVINQHFSDIFRLFWSHGYRALTTDSERRQIHEADVERWTSQQKTDFGSTNYLFAP